MYAPRYDNGPRMSPYPGGGYRHEPPPMDMSRYPPSSRGPPVTSQPRPMMTSDPRGMMTSDPRGMMTSGVNVNPGFKPWSSGTCAFFDDIKSCLCVYFCGLCAECLLAKRLGENPCIVCCVPGASILLRTKLRMLLGIQGSICGDCLMMEFCWPCAHCQLWREMDAAGIP